MRSVNPESPNVLPPAPKMVTYREVMDALHIDSAHLGGSAPIDPIREKVYVLRDAGQGDMIPLEVVIKWVDQEISQRSKWLEEYKQLGKKGSIVETHANAVYFLNMVREKLVKLQAGHSS